MNFTPKIKVLPMVAALLTIAVLGLMGWSSHVASTVPVIPAVQTLSAPAFQTTGPVYYQPVSAWYKSKHWWKRNAPIVGGAGGGALVGGLLGGGKGAIIGGAVGGGGGYLYKRSRHHHHHHDEYNYRR